MEHPSGIFTLKEAKTGNGLWGVVKNPLCTHENAPLGYHTRLTHGIWVHQCITNDAIGPEYGKQDSKLLRIL